jgi:hypothetical protein
MTTVQDSSVTTMVTPLSFDLLKAVSIGRDSDVVTRPVLTHCLVRVGMVEDGTKKYGPVTMMCATTSYTLLIGVAATPDVPTPSAEQVLTWWTQLGKSQEAGGGRQALLDGTAIDSVLKMVPRGRAEADAYRASLCLVTTVKDEGDQARLQVNTNQGSMTFGVDIFLNYPNTDGLVHNNGRPTPVEDYAMTSLTLDPLQKVVKSLKDSVLVWHGAGGGEAASARNKQFISIRTDKVYITGVTMPVRNTKMWDGTDM